MKKILFISHDSSRTGAPLLLLKTIEWLKKNKAIEPIILIKTGGELDEEFKKLGKTYFWLTHKRLKKPFFFRQIDRIKNKLKIYKSPEDILIEQIKTENVKLIYANTIVSSELVFYLKKTIDVPVVAHIHELESIFNPKYNAEGMHGLDMSNHIIAASNSVRDFLINKINLSREKVTTIYEFAINIKSEATLYRSDIGIPEDAFVVMGSGNPQWRKGIDIFFSLALKLSKKTNIPFYFLWIGGSSDEQQWVRLLNIDIAKAGIQDIFKIITKVKNPTPYFKLADIFLMTSREDPFPLVNLEAGMQKKPVICFKGSGGSEELLSGCGLAVPYLDVESMENSLLKLVDNQELRTELGLKLYNRVKDNFLLEHIGPQIFHIVNKYL